MGVQRHPTAVTPRSGSLGGTDVRCASRTAARVHNYTSPALDPLHDSLRVIRRGKERRPMAQRAQDVGRAGSDAGAVAKQLQLQAWALASA
jgi:hypothetical protein